MNWSQLLADAGIPDVPGRAALLEDIKRQREQRVAAADAELALAIERQQERLAARGDSRKAFRSRVRMGA